MIIEVTKQMKILTGFNYMYYCIEEHPNIDFRESCKLLRYAVMDDPNKFKATVEKLIENPNKDLIPFYTAKDDIQKTKGMEIVGTIIDGGLYLG